jgi:cytochrome c oxidase assembly protein subunit 11
MEENSKATHTVVAKLLLTVVGMFIFAIWVMPPIYDVFCDITGLNGKTGGQYKSVSAEVDTSRTITVQFFAANNETMPWVFKPMIKSIKVHPGEEVEVKFFAENNTQRDMVGQAVPSLVPFKAVEYFHKTECFCFNNQPLKAGESAELPLRFIVDLDVAKTVNTITLSYTLFDISQTAVSSLASIN